MRALRAVLPIVSWAPAYRRADLRPDLVAGLTVAAMLVPQAMAYALLAGLPPAVGLYAASVPLVAYAVLGTSRQLAVGPVAIVSLLTASALRPLFEEGAVGYVSAAALLALLVGAVHLLLGAARLGWVTNLLSHSVLVGFTAAAALIIASSQLRHLLGVDAPTGERFVETLWEVGRRVGDTEPWTAGVAAVALAALVVLRRVAPRVPGALAVVAVTTAAVPVLGLAERGVAVVGEVPRDLPAFGLPDLDGGLVRSLASAAVLITLVGFMESVAVAKVYARRNRYEIDPNRELVALGGANVTSGLFGGYPVTGGFSRTAVNAHAGARTPLASLVTAAVVLLTIAAFTPLLENLPRATLAAVIVVAVVALVDVTEVRHIARVKRSDLLTAAIAFGATLALGVELGLVVAIGSSMVVTFVRIARPHTAELGRVPGTTLYRNVERFPEVETTPGVAVLRVDVSLNYLNASFLRRRFARLEADHPDLAVIVLDACGVNDIDASGEQTLADLVDEYDRRGIAVRLAALKGPVRDVLVRSGLWARLGTAIHASVHEAVAAGRPEPPGEGRPRPADRRASGVDERG